MANPMYAFSTNKLIATGHRQYPIDQLPFNKGANIAAYRLPQTLLAY